MNVMALRIGQSQLRFEDDSLIRGAGSYAGDDFVEGELTMAVVRSPVAAGVIKSIDTSSAKEAPGVVAVFTGEDVVADGLTAFEPRVQPPAPGGGKMFVPPAPPLRTERVRYLGDPVAVVIAETRAGAEAAAEMVMADIDPLPAVTTAAEAVADGAPLVWDEVPGNVSFLSEFGDKTKVDEAFGKSAHVLKHSFPISRVTAVCMEPRNAVARFDLDSDTITLRVGTQASHRMGNGVAQVMGIEPAKVRVISRQAGGSFGMRNNPFPEEVLICWAAKRIGRPVRWAATRTESFMSDAHAREQVIDVELALDAEGHFLAMRVVSMPSVGAYYGSHGGQSLLSNIGGIAGVYRTPAIHMIVKAVHTNTQYIAPYRGAGRPEMTYAMERMADLAAAELGIDRVEIRRKNMIAPDQMPFKTGLVYTYDSGEFATVLDKTLAASDWDGFAARREEAKTRGKLRGIGISNPIEIAGGPAGTPMPEFARLTVAKDGKFIAHLGSGDSGQGHVTTFRQIVSDRFNVEPDDIVIVSGDTGQVPKGTGTFGTRTVGAAGTALAVAGDEVLDQAKADAAEALEAAVDDLVFEDGKFTIAGTDRSVSLVDLAAKSEKGYSAEWMGATENATFPNGCHVCEVEVDPDTGVTEVVRYTVVDDVGVVVNPLLVKGQIHGGVVQGLGQVFGEQIVYDENGQLLTASFMDYQMPRADTVPSFDVASHAVPTKVNRLGVKGAGEAGTVGALAAGIGAVVDALSPYGIRHVDMPATPLRVWQAIQDSKKS
jgi:aerobic carbon-monoxide dehydrogenase large subunit